MAHVSYLLSLPPLLFLAFPSPYPAPIVFPHLISKILKEVQRLHVQGSFFFSQVGDRIEEWGCEGCHCRFFLTLEMYGI